MAGVKCIHCNCIGTLENQGILFDGKADDMPNSDCFKYKGHNPFSGNLHYECSRCEKIIFVDPMDFLGAMGAQIITDVREKPRGKSIFDRLFFSQEETDDYHHEMKHTNRRR